MRLVHIGYAKKALVKEPWRGYIFRVSRNQAVTFWSKSP